MPSSLSISPGKVVIFVIVVGVFIVIAWLVSKAFASACPSGQHYDNTQKACIMTCPVGQTYYPNPPVCLVCPPGQVLGPDGQCDPNCSAGSVLCGGSCINPQIYTCINNIPCAMNMINPHNPTGPATCCPPGTTYNSTQGICLSGCSTGAVLCGTTCCLPGQQCLGGTICCDPSHVHGAQCCKIWASVDGCCNDNQGTDGQYCTSPCGNTECKVDNQECYTINKYDASGKVSSTTFGCSNIGCTFTEVDYNPIPIQGPNGPIHVCKLPTDVNNNGPFATCAVPNIAGFVKTESISGSDGPCAEDNCYNSMQSEGVEDVTVNVLPNGQVICNADISCAAAEGTRDKCGNCPIDQYNQNPQCCYDQNANYTGLICAPGKVCNSNGQCTLPPNCNERGTWDGTKCVCDTIPGLSSPTFTGENCQYITNNTDCANIPQAWWSISNGVQCQAGGAYQTCNWSSCIQDPNSCVGARC